MLAVGCRYPDLPAVGGELSVDADVATPACGDGAVTGEEQCDDGNTTSGDGCSATCMLEPGFACASSPSACHRTTCGDGIVEGFEECDDGDVVPFDGCSPACTLEPDCHAGECAAICGDGFKDPSEQCDDGNLLALDGCSPTCTIEPGWRCSDFTKPPTSSLTLPILYRDMLYKDTPAPRVGHPDFENLVGAKTGLVASHLGPDGEPVIGSNTGGYLTGSVAFCWWFHQSGCGVGGTNPYAQLVYRDAAGSSTALRLVQQSNPVDYSYSSTAFFPLDGLGWNAGATPQVDYACDGTTAHNFSFTSEIHFPFTYHQGAAELSFAGDDDVWVFVGGQLAVDLGGVHGSESATVPIDSSLGLQEGHTYSIDVFQAERHVCDSDYTLGLNNFTQTGSACVRN